MTNLYCPWFSQAFTSLSQCKKEECALFDTTRGCCSENTKMTPEDTELRSSVPAVDDWLQRYKQNIKGLTDQVNNEKIDEAIREAKQAKLDNMNKTFGV